MEPRQWIDPDRRPRYDRHGNGEGRGAYFGWSSSSPDDYDLHNITRSMKRLNKGRVPLFHAEPTTKV